MSALYPSVVLENQFGEVSNNFIVGGSSRLRANFTVSATDSGGDGLTGLVAEGIAAVYMHTSATPSAGNPNPAAGYILVKTEKAFSSFESLASTVTPPQSGASLLVASAGLTAGLVYVITVLGTTSQAQWEVLGVPAGVTAALGFAFVAIATSCTGTGAVQVPKTGGAAILSISPLGNPAVGQLDDGSGAWITLACYGIGGTFTGSALGSHTHDLLIKGGQAGSTTNDVAVYGSLDTLGKEQASDATIVGADSATKGGVVAVTAGTPAGSVTAANAIATPVNGTVIDLCFVVVPMPAVLL